MRGNLSEIRAERGGGTGGSNSDNNDSGYSYIRR